MVMVGAKGSCDSSGLYLDKPRTSSQSLEPACGRVAGLRPARGLPRWALPGVALSYRRLAQAMRPRRLLDSPRRRRRPVPRRC